MFINQIKGKKLIASGFVLRSCTWANNFMHYIFAAHAHTYMLYI